MNRTSQTGGDTPAQSNVHPPPLAIALDARACDVRDPVAVAARIPDAASREPGTRVCVLGAATRGGGWLGRWRRSVPVPRAARCTALLARGYVGIGAGVDEESGAEMAWGVAP